MQVNKGVNLNIIKEKKFKTINIAIRFKADFKAQILANRILISNLWETSNKNLTSNRDLDLKLSDMYGATFSTRVAKKGKKHLLTINLSLVNPALVNDNNLLEEALNFLKDVIFNPLVSESGGLMSFDRETYAREQKNLIKYLEASVEDRSYYASQRLTSLYFTDENMKLPSSATAELVREEDRFTTYNYYQKMLKEDLVDIFVLGNFDDQTEDFLKESFKKFGFTDRLDYVDVRSEAQTYFYKQELNQVEVYEEDKPANQSIIEFAYNLPVYFGDSLYMALLVYNGLLGAFAHSKLFMNVREKEGLAYYASSSIDSYRGFLRIKAGIEASKKDRVIFLVDQEVEAMRLGDFSQDDLEQTKKMLETSYKLAQDSAGNLIEQAFIRGEFPGLYKNQEIWLKDLWSVTREDVMKVAELVSLQTIYFLKGDDLDAQED
ncbi:pitrilysin family protein [Streptococcaceae bacterium ESL0687]|nr:pitrilysin family protein [Streptococcaceae bacterium ESL0687]